MLTAKQMKFCEEYLRLDNATEAYIAAYQNNSSKATAQVESSRLLKRDDIQAHILKLRKPVEKAIKRKIMNEREYKKKLIQERIDECIARDDDAAIARYIEIWNKMDGEYANGGKEDFDPMSELGNVDTATLLQLVSNG
jgi:phage terminase small subunit